jgi:hypothetical protein
MRLGHPVLGSLRLRVRSYNSHDFLSARPKFRTAAPYHRNTMTSCFAVALTLAFVWISCDLAVDVAILVEFRATISALVHDATMVSAVVLYLVHESGSVPAL